MGIAFGLLYFSVMSVSNVCVGTVVAHLFLLAASGRVELPQTHVTVLHHVILTLHTKLSTSFCRCFGSEFLDVDKRDYVTANEARLKIRMNDTRRTRSFGALPNSPALNLPLPSSNYETNHQKPTRHRCSAIKRSLPHQHQQ